MSNENVACEQRQSVSEQQRRNEKANVPKDKRTTLSLKESSKDELRYALDYPKYIDSDEDRILYLIDKIRGKE